MNTAVCLISYNRPEYFQKTLGCLINQTTHDGFDFFLYQDYCEETPKLSERCVELFMSSALPRKKTTVHPQNVGPAVNMFVAKEECFEKGYDRVVVIEDDVLTHPRFLLLVRQLLDRYADDEGVGYVRGKDAIQNPMNNYAFWRRSWDIIRDPYEEYVEFIAPYKYTDLPQEIIDALPNKFGALTQDGIKMKVFRDAGLKRVETSRPKTKHIGAVGMHFTQDHYVDKGFDKVKIQDWADIILPVWNQPELTNKCLESISRYTKFPYRLIIIDNGSDEETQMVIMRHTDSTEHAIIRNEENLGWIKAINQGIAESDNEYVVFQNNDTEVTEGWLTKMIGSLTEGVGAVGPKTDNVEQYQGMVEGEGEIETSKLAFFSVVFPREVVTEIGGLDEDFGMGYGDDDLYCHQLKKAGYKLKINTDVMVKHVRRASTGEGAQEMINKNVVLLNEKLREL